MIEYLFFSGWITLGEVIGLIFIGNYYSNEDPGDPYFGGWLD
jgi:hypothetical protein